MVAFLCPFVVLCLLGRTSASAEEGPLPVALLVIGVLTSSMGDCFDRICLACLCFSQSEQSQDDISKYWLTNLLTWSAAVNVYKRKCGGFWRFGQTSGSCCMLLQVFGGSEATGRRPVWRGQTYMERRCLHGLCISYWLASVLAQWSLVTTSGPEARAMQVAACDSTRQQLWVHGGMGSGNHVLQDLWVFDFESKSWNLMPQQHQKPVPRSGHVASWDQNERALWIHGGYDGVHFFKDLWKYQDYHWSLVTDSTASAPSPRADHVAVWDAASSALWLHGGYDGLLHEDLWRFDSKVVRWTQIIGNNPPSARSHHVAIWDDTSSALWVHGGYDGGSLPARK